MKKCGGIRNSAVALYKRFEVIRNNKEHLLKNIFLGALSTEGGK